MDMPKISILGCGNIGTAIAIGLKKSRVCSSKNIYLTRRKNKSLEKLNTQGFVTSNDNKKAVEESNIIILSVGPNHLMDLLNDISSKLNSKQIIISVVSGIQIKNIREIVGNDMPIIRAMPNTAASSCESMTCIASLDQFKKVLSEINCFF